MIELTRLNGSRFLVNSELIERVDETPDTVITLTDGTRYLVEENLEQVLEQVRYFRASILAAASHLTVSRTGTGTGPDLRVVPGTDGQD